MTVSTIDAIWFALLMFPFIALMNQRIGHWLMLTQHYTVFNSTDLFNIADNIRHLLLSLSAQMTAGQLRQAEWSAN